jgi:LuxR family transcriptional regulator, maltose regulon positive regulatory protein
MTRNESLAATRRTRGVDTPRARPAGGAKGPSRARGLRGGQPGAFALPADLLATKLQIPRSRPNVLRRSRLQAQLDAGLDRLLTLLSAPAGFGKTTLVGDWVQQRQATGPLRVAWLSLDDADNDPVRFMRYLAAALHRITPRASETLLTLLQPSPAPSLEGLLRVLINELVELDEDCTLVIDDYHVLRDRSVHEAVAFLLDHMPPRFHLTISTREDPPLPLPRLRGRNAVLELRQADLRFTSQEAAAFLDEGMGLTLSAADVRTLEERTEGWIAGLQMAALSMQGHGDVSGFIAAFSGSNRYILDYLVEEVLDRQPAGVQDFLLRTSILDRLCGPLCDAVLDLAHEDGNGTREAHPGQEILERLEHSNLFLVPLDTERRWYRYHPLFADLLRLRLHQTHPDLLPGLHDRASVWYEHAGLIPEAIDHALAGSDVERAAVLIEQHAPQLIGGGRPRMLLGWLDHLPIDLVRLRPHLTVARALALAITGDLGGAESFLQDTEGALQSGTPAGQAQIIRGAVAAVRGGIALYMVGDLERGVAYSRRALDLLPAAERATCVARPIALRNAAAAFLISGEAGPDSERAIAAAFDAARQPGSLAAPLRANALLARLQAMRGHLHLAAGTYAGMAQVVPGPPCVDALIGVLPYQFGMGDLLAERNELDEAERHLAAGLEALTDTTVVMITDILLGYTAMARVRQARGDGPGAIAAMEAFIALARRRNFAPQLLAQAAGYLARLRLAQGDLRAAARWAEETDLPVDRELRYPMETEYLTLARLLIAQGRPAEATALLGRLLEAAEPAARVRSMIEILILRALSLHADGHAADALSDLSRAMALAEPGGYVRLFLDEEQPVQALLQRAAAHGAASAYAARLLAAARLPAPGLSGGQRPRLDTLAEPLTEREREILRLLAAGASNPEIARKLIVAVSTVKTHVHHTLGKLNARSRASAVARARELNLI